MYVGMLYNTFVCCVTGLSALVVFWQIRKIRKIKKREYNQGLDYFLLLLGLLWVLVGIRIFFVWLGQSDLEMFMWDWITGPLTYIHIAPIFFYFGWAFFKNKKVRFLFEGFFISMILLTVLSLFLYGSTPGEVTPWGTKPIANIITHKIFTYAIFLPALICIIGDLFKRLRNWKRTRNPIEQQLFGFDFGFLIYALIAVFDGLAIAKGWTLLLVRIGIMISPLVIYLFAAEKDKE